MTSSKWATLDDVNREEEQRRVRDVSCDLGVCPTVNVFRASRVTVPSGRVSREIVRSHPSPTLRSQQFEHGGGALLRISMSAT